MGTEAAWIPLVVGALGAGASYYNTTQTAKRQDNALADQIRAQGQRQSQADAVVQDAILQQSQSDPSGRQQESFNSYLEQLNRSREAAGAGLRQIGAVSDRFDTDASSANEDIAATGQRTAGIMSRIDAPLRQRQDEGIAFGRLSSDLDRVRALSDSDRYLGDIRMRGIRRNPWIDAAATGASIYASGYQPASAATTAGNAVNFAGGFRGLGGWGY